MHLSWDSLWYQPKPPASRPNVNPPFKVSTTPDGWTSLWPDPASCWWRGSCSSASPSTTSAPPASPPHSPPPQRPFAWKVSSQILLNSSSAAEKVKRIEHRDSLQRIQTKYLGVEKCFLVHRRGACFWKIERLQINGDNNDNDDTDDLKDLYQRQWRLITSLLSAIERLLVLRRITRERAGVSWKFYFYFFNFYFYFFFF